MSLLPPCRLTCKRLVQRTNYQTLIWKNSHAQFPEIPDLKSHGWKENGLGNLDYDWCEGPIIPQVSRFNMHVLCSHCLIAFWYSGRLQFMAIRNSIGLIQILIHDSRCYVSLTDFDQY